MTFLKMLRNPFALIGQGFVLGGLLVIVLQDPPPAHAAQPSAIETSR
ncbi:MAG: hypothetical protein AB7O91_02400 [Sphingomonas sp.]